MQLIAGNYRTKDGRVNYRKFCDLMEHSEMICNSYSDLKILSAAYNVPQLEKKPTEIVRRPERGHLLQVH